MILRPLTLAAVGKATAARILEVDHQARCASDPTASVASSLERMLTAEFFQKWYHVLHRKWFFTTTTATGNLELRRTNCGDLESDPGWLRRTGGEPAR
jgi:hypothetical protein